MQPMSEQPKENLDENLWFTTDVDYASFLKKPKAFRKKTGGAKQGGKYTGVYTFENPLDSDQKLTMLIKQGDSIGETVAEFVGANLYQLLIPDYSAKAILVRDNLTEPFSQNNVYVTSIYEQNATKVQDAFEVAGYTERPVFARARHEVSKALGSKEEGLIRTVILDDQQTADNSLGKILANVLWQGDHDVHMGNFVRVEKEGKAKYMKIDHGFSFFNFGTKIVNIFDPLGGEKVDISLSRAYKGGKLVEFYPFNNFWDLAAEKERLYFSGPFITSCEDIAQLDKEIIRENIRASLLSIKETYGPEANKALAEFSKRMGMPHSQVYAGDARNNPDELIQNIERFMTYRLEARQKTMEKLAVSCRKKAQKMKTGHHALSREIEKLIIKKMKEADNDFHKVPTLNKEIALLKLLEQANDLGYLSVKNNELIITGNFYFLNHGIKEGITPDSFKEKLNNDETKKVLSSDTLQMMQKLNTALSNPNLSDITEKMKEIKINKNKDNTTKKQPFPILSGYKKSKSSSEEKPVENSQKKSTLLNQFSHDKKPLFNKKEQPSSKVKKQLKPNS